MTISAGMRLVAVIVFALAFFSVAPGGYPMVPLGLCLWVGSSFA